MVLAQKGATPTLTGVFKAVNTTADVVLSLEAWGNNGGTAADVHIDSKRPFSKDIGVLNSSAPASYQLQAHLDDTNFNGSVKGNVGNPVEGSFVTSGTATGAAVVNP